MATHSNILTWKIPWTEEPDGLQSKGSQRVGHNRVSTKLRDSASQNPHWGWELMTSRDPAPFLAPATGIAFLTSAWNLFQLTSGSVKMTELLVWLPWHPTLAISSTFSGARSRPFCPSLFLNVVLLMSQPLTARWGPVSRCTSHPCSLQKGHLRTRCSSRLPTLLDDRRQALWRSCCQWWLQREGAAQFSKPPSPWHSTNRTWFFIYCRHGNLGCLIKMTTWRSSKVAPPWQVPGMYCERLSLSLSRPGNVAWIPRGMVADSLREPSPG